MILYRLSQGSPLLCDEVMWQVIESVLISDLLQAHPGLLFQGEDLVQVIDHLGGLVEVRVDKSEVLVGQGHRHPPQDTRKNRCRTDEWWDANPPIFCRRHHG